MPKSNEDRLCHLFAERVKNSQEFQSWVLSQTKFGGYPNHVRLLHEEQMSIRPRKEWWRHWWCHIPELNKDRETDIFMVFENTETKRRFALHCENKTEGYKFSDGQAEAYAIRAKHMANKAKYLNYEDYQTVLIAPNSFREKFRTECEAFEVHISYENIAKSIPEYSTALK
ncbi:MAG: hypothetical protein K9G30_04045 [Parvibaculum sp.]|nr:hypothetical protein [Parvibaculum sp.]